MNDDEWEDEIRRIGHKYGFSDGVIEMLLPLCNRRLSPDDAFLIAAEEAGLGDAAAGLFW